MSFLRLRSTASCCFALCLAACGPDVADGLFDDGGDGGNTSTGTGNSGGDPSTTSTQVGPTTTGTSTTTTTTSTTTTTTGGPTCGDNVIDEGESCDGSNLNGASCLAFGFSSPGNLACSDCNYDTSGCEPTCDGFEVEPGELCDGFNLDGHDCTEFGYEDPSGLACNRECNDLDTSGCSAVCNNGTLEPGETCDGGTVTVTCVDLGFSQPTPGAPDCDFNCQIDAEDCVSTCGDGNIEPGESCDDSNTLNGDGCSSLCVAEGNCLFPIPISVDLGQVTIDATTVGGSVDLTSTANNCTGAAGPSRVYLVTAEEDGFLTVWLDRPLTSFDSVLYARTSCTDEATTILCHDNFGALAANGGEVISFQVSAGQATYVIVDGGPAMQGNYRMVVDLSEGSTCNDPVPLPVWSGQPIMVLGNTQGQTQSTGGSCGGGSQGTGATDVVYQIDREAAGITNMNVGLPPAFTTFDSVLYGRLQCGSQEADCDDSVAPMGGEMIALPFVNNDIRFVWVDGFNGAQGDYGMVVTPTP